MLRLALFILFLPIALCAKPTYDLAICTIFQNDAPYLKEWIEFHKLQGVKHFFLYNNHSDDDYKTVLHPYIEQQDVTLVDWDYSYTPGICSQWNDIQSEAYKDCLNSHGKECNWLAFLDTDEFLYCVNGQKLTTFLKQFKPFAALGVNWQMFGTSGVWDIPKNSLMIELLTHCADQNNPTNRHIKSIVQPRYVVDVNNPHYCIYVMGKYAVDSNKIQIPNAFTTKVNVDKIRINHYWTRTEQFFYKCKIPRRITMNNEDPKMIEAINDSFNVSSDLTIQQFVSSLKSKL